MAFKGDAIKNRSYRTNDGSSIPDPGRAAVNKGFLNRNTDYSNETAFNDTTASDRSMNGQITGMQSWRKDENLDDPGLDASGGWLYKQGTPYGEAAMFNQLPPGQDINDQNYAAIYEMPLKTVTAIGYPGDGAFPVRDIPE
jgi:hypothetical protein